MREVRRRSERQRRILWWDDVGKVRGVRFVIRVTICTNMSASGQIYACTGLLRIARTEVYAVEVDYAAAGHCTNSSLQTLGDIPKVSRAVPSHCRV
jgi:hypothetical protein